MNVVIDTNVLLQVAFTQKPPRIVWDKLIAGEYTLCVTEDILYEYQEKVIFDNSENPRKQIASGGRNADTVIDEDRLYLKMKDYVIEVSEVNEL